MSQEKKLYTQGIISFVQCSLQGLQDKVNSSATTIASFMAEAHKCPGSPASLTGWSFTEIVTFASKDPQEFAYIKDADSKYIILQNTSFQ